MGRELKRVPINFDWPLNKVWGGFISPEHLRSEQCEDCDGQGYNPATTAIADDFYGNERPQNRWMDKITQDEADALVKEGRLSDLKRRILAPKITADQVNEWQRNARGFGHDAINRHILIEARAKRLGVWGWCPRCEGDGSVYESDALKKLAEDWRATEPPTGEGYQVWETVSEGSPISPVFKTPEECVAWLVRQGYSKTAAENFVKMGWVPSMVMTGGKLYTNIEAAGIGEERS